MLYLYGRRNDSLEPVIPSFPIGDDNNFIGINTWEKYHYAELQPMGEDPDELLKKLEQQFPALPRILLENYIMIPLIKLSSFSAGERFQIFITQDTASLRNINDGKFIELWDSQPNKEYHD